MIPAHEPKGVSISTAASIYREQLGTPVAVQTCTLPGQVIMHIWIAHGRRPILRPRRSGYQQPAISETCAATILHPSARRTQLWLWRPIVTAPIR
ncbi:MAG: hypothetical protein QOI59_2974 [Gammaproteobacteria bacterium]|nr:hypothetical protein [Gammaproteobacteria bacterium]